MILVLNTIYWNVDAYKRGPNITLIGNIQMMWLEKQLLAAKQQSYKVIIVGHIPPR